LLTGQRAGERGFKIGEQQWYTSARRYKRIARALVLVFLVRPLGMLAPLAECCRVRQYDAVRTMTDHSKHQACLHYVTAERACG
jgi:hypothetical protein